MIPGGPARASPSGLMERQTECLRQMLNFNEPLRRSSDGSWSSECSEPSWKVLVYDVVGQTIMSPLFSVKDLRDSGVTLHLLLHSERDPVPDVPAVYFCQPTEENLSRIGQDLTSGLYGSYHFNFISSISRQQLEDLAAVALRTNAVSQIEKVFDQHVNFISLDDAMFSLGKSSCQNDVGSFYALNRADTTDSEMENILGLMVDGLFAVCVTLGTVPVIRCPPGNAAEAVAVRLDKKLRENLKDARNSLFAGGAGVGVGGFYRPLLVIIDRQVDLATSLHHTWTYQALAHDVLEYELNRVTLANESGSHQRKTSKECYLDNKKDTFWVNNKGSPFPQVAERIQEELEDYRSKEDDIKRMKGDMGAIDPTGMAANGGGSGEEESFLSDNTQKLTTAVSSLPVLLEKKRLIDMHTSLATAILDQIKLRKLDVYFETEEKIMSSFSGGSSGGSERSLMQIFQDGDAGTPADKLRLFLVFFLCSGSITEAEVDQFAKTLEDDGCDLSALRYLKRWKSLNRKMTNLSESGAFADYSGGGTKTVNMFSKLLSQSSSFVMEGVKNLVVKRHNLPVTKILEELMEVRQGRYQEEYRYFDPKILRSGQDNIPRAKNPFQEAIVFMVGGGNYIEYHNLMDYMRSKQPPSGSTATSLNFASGSQQQKRNVIYGCSILSNANQMLSQLSKLGKEM